MVQIHSGVQFIKGIIMQVQYILTEAEYEDYKKLKRNQGYLEGYRSLYSTILDEANQLEGIVKAFIMEGNNLSVSRGSLVFMGDAIKQRKLLAIDDPSEDRLKLIIE